PGSSCASCRRTARRYTRSSRGHCWCRCRGGEVGCGDAWMLVGRWPSHMAYAWSGKLGRGRRIDSNGRGDGDEGGGIALQLRRITSCAAYMLGNGRLYESRSELPPET